MAKQPNRRFPREAFDIPLAHLAAGRQEITVPVASKAEATRLRYLFYVGRKACQDAGDMLWGAGVVVRIEEVGGDWFLTFCKDAYDRAAMEAMMRLGPVDQGSLPEAPAPSQEPAQGPDGSHQSEALSRIFGGGSPGSPKEGN